MSHINRIQNVVFLAAELAAAGVPAGRAAIMADKLCRLGRQFKRIEAGEFG